MLESDAATVTYSTPRRLAVLIKGVIARQKDTEEKLTGPAWKIAFNAEGKPTGAAEAFAKKAGVEVAALEKVTLPKGDYVGATVARKGRAADEVLAEHLPKEIAAIYWAKSMYWRAGKPERFVRPLRWLVALLDKHVVPVEFAGMKAGNVSYGHRVLHGEAAITIPAPDTYAAALASVYVIVDVAERRHKIRKALDAVTRTVDGARWREDEDLIETVTHLTEWPSVLLGSFEAAYLDLPEEVLVTVMRDHQKYFAVEDGEGKLAPYFLAVLNTDGDPQGLIRHGNERVLRARFNDARFFWNFDQKISLNERVELLKSVTFQKNLGSYAWKSEQNLEVAKALTAALTGPRMDKDEVDVLFALNATNVVVVGLGELDLGALTVAVKLAKTDLTAELVKEFTELQGIIGGLYAHEQYKREVRRHGAIPPGFNFSKDKVAQAIYWQYRPASTDDKIPPTIEGQLLGLADRIQTIAAMFSIGLAPTGSKDPFALRRAANAIIRILAKSNLPLTLDDVLHAPGTESGQGVGEDGKLQPDSPLRAFLKERLHFYLRDICQFPYDVVNAVLARDSSDVRDAIARAEELSKARGSEDFLAVSVAFKRMKNILHQAETMNYQIGSTKIPQLEREATKLAEFSANLAPQVAMLRKLRNYGQALTLIATLRPVVDAFFENVMVIDPNPDIRATHLALIQEVLDSFSGIADFSEMVSS